MPDGGRASDGTWELDAEVAEELFGEPKPPPAPDVYVPVCRPVPSPKGAWLLTDVYGEPECVWQPRRFSADIAVAWEVVERGRMMVSMEVEFELYGNEDGSWNARFGFWDASADTAPEAICRAALVAVRAE